MYTIVLFIIFGALSGVQCTLISPQTSLGLISNARISSIKSIDAIFSTLPSESDLQQILYSADAVALSRLLQIIETKTEDIPCDALVVYADSIIGMLKSATHSKQFLVSQLEVIYKTANQEIARIKKELLRLNEQKDSLKLNQLRNQILFLVIDLGDAYKLINAQTDKVQSFQAQIVGYQKDIQLRISKSSQQRNLLLQKKLSISGLDSEIIQLEKHLADLRQQRIITTKDAEKIQNSVSQHTKQISLSRQKIDGLSRAIQASNKKIDDNKRISSRLEIDLERLRTNLGIGIEKEKQLSEKITGLKDQLTDQEGRLLQREFDTLANMIKVWNLFIPKFQKQNAELYYNCFGAGSIETLQTGNVAVYVIKGVNFPDYLENNYGLSSSNTRANSEFIVTDIFGGTWTNKYGAAFSDISLSNNQTVLNGDFSCLNPSLVQSGKGKIVKIVNRYITVQNDNKSKTILTVGACSRIQSTKIIPQIGQTVYYKGVADRQSGNINLYAASCF